MAGEQGQDLPGQGDVLPEELQGWNDPTIIADTPAVPPADAKDPTDPDAPPAGADGAKPDAEIPPGDRKPDGDQQQKPNADAKPQDQGQPPNIMVPKARLDEEARRRRELEENYIYERGRADALEEALQKGGKPGDEPPDDGKAKPPSFEEQIAAKRAELSKIDEALDEGTTTFKQAGEAKAKIQDEIDGLREQRIAATVQQQVKPAQQPQSPVSISDQNYYEQHASQLVADYPAITTATGDDLKRLHKLAVATAEADGKPYQKGSPKDALRFREDMAKLAQEKLPAWHPDRQIPVKRAGDPPPPNNAGIPPGAPPGVKPPTAADQRRAELETLKGHPPDLRAVGRPAPAEGLTDARIVAMEEIEMERMSQEQLMAIANR